MSINEEFQKKINDEHEDFLEMIDGYDAEEIVANARYIANFQDIYAFLYMQEPLSDEQMQHFLKVNNIIELIARRYSPSQEEMHETFLVICEDIADKKLYSTDCSKKANELFQRMRDELDAKENADIEYEKDIFNYVVKISSKIDDHIADSLMQFKNPTEVICTAIKEDKSVMKIAEKIIDYIENNDIYTLPHKLDHERVLDESKWRHDAIREITDIIPQPDFQTTLSWIDFYRTVEMNCCDGKLQNPYTAFIAALKSIAEEYGDTILQQLYDVENGTMMLEEQLTEAAKFLADGGDVRRIRELAEQDAFLKPYEELKEELEQEQPGGMNMC